MQTIGRDPERQTARMSRRLSIAMVIAGLVLAAFTPDGLEQWLAGLPYSPATEEALIYVRDYQDFAGSAGLLRPIAAVRKWVTDLRGQRFWQQPDG